MTGVASEGRTLARRWRALRPGPRWLLAAGAAVVGLNLALAGLGRVTGGPTPGGPASSSYTTGRDGLAAYAELLGRHGHPVSRLRSRLDRADLDTGATVVVADPSTLSPGEARALERFVRGGGRLLASGRAVGPALARLLGPGLHWGPEAVPVARPLTPAPEVDGVGSVRSAGLGSWREAGSTLPVLAGGEGTTLATVATVGRGRVVAVADVSVWQNRLLDRAGNAAFGLAAAGPPARPVRFAEAHHGYGAGGGLSAVPARWRWGLAVATAGTLVWLWSRGRRLGPPERPERELPPPRRAYVDALAASLVRTNQPAGALQPLQAAGRELLARRAGMAADAGDEAFRRQGARLGLAEGDVAALLAPPRSREDVLAAGRALARLEGPG